MGKIRHVMVGIVEDEKAEKRHGCGEAPQAPREARRARRGPPTLPLTRVEGGHKHHSSVGQVMLLAGSSQRRI